MNLIRARISRQNQGLLSVGSERRADHSSRGVLPIVLRRCVSSRHLKNEEAMGRVGQQRHRKNEDYVNYDCIF